MLRVRTPEGELLAERGGQVNLPDAFRRLGVHHVKRPGAEVDVPPPKGQRLANAQAGAREQCEQDPANT
jgi:hypothetical protein